MLSMESRRVAAVLLVICPTVLYGLLALGVGLLRSPSRA